MSTIKTGLRSSFDDNLQYSDQDLEKAYETFLTEEPQGNRLKLVNFSTFFGAIMFLSSMLYLVQQLGLSVGPDLSGFMSGLPILGGILVALTGFGFILREYPKSKERNKRQKIKKLTKTLNKDYNKWSEQYSKIDEKAEELDEYALRRQKKIFKSRTDKKIAGVCGGLADYFNISSTLIRLIFIILTFMGYGSMILVYFILSMVLSKEPRIIENRKKKNVN